ncbi:MAG TPA: hypothetical protein VGC35_11290, partial [Allosphingosinicella sp.]
GWPTDGSAPPGLTVTGTFRSESLEGTYGDDILYGLDGRDTLTGGRGADVLYGDSGDDTLSGGIDDDVLHGGDGADTIRGEAGNDEVHGGEGNDIIFATQGYDTVYGDGGDDVIEFYALPVLVDGGEGNDWIRLQSAEGVNNAGVTINGGAGNDTLYVESIATATLTIDMGDGNDSVFLPFNRAATLLLGSGNDILAVAPAYAAEGMGVIDVHDFATGDAGDHFVTVDLVDGASNYQYGRNPFASGHARLIANGAGDTLLQIDLDGTGTQHDWSTAVIFRYTSPDAFTAYNLGFGTAGADTMRLDVGIGLSAFGDNGNDILFLGAHFGAGDYLDGGEGLDTVVLQGDYSAGFLLEESSLLRVEYLALMSGSDTSFGGTGTSIFDYVLAAHDENLEAGQTLTVHARGLLAGESLIFDGSAEIDARFILLGGAGDDALIGGQLADTLDGGTGDDTLAGGLGNDIYLVDSAGDEVLEDLGEGTDEVRTALGSRLDPALMYTLPEHVENLTGTSASGQGVHGNWLNNVVVMGTGSDLVVLESGGNDLVSGGGGDDFLYWGATFNNADRADGGSGFDTLGLLGTYTLAFQADDLFSVEKLAVYSSGNAAAPNSYSLTMHDNNVASGQRMMVVARSLLANEAFTFNGSAETNGSFNVRGGRGADAITGGAKADLIWGYLGADSLTGGGGNDVFEYQAAAESTAAARDSILDFTAGDKINLMGIDADGNAANGNSFFQFIGGAAFTKVAGQLRVTAAEGGGYLVEGDTNGDGSAELVIHVQTTGGHVLGSGDIWF